MSIINCAECSHPIDTDTEEVYGAIKGDICRNCRDEKLAGNHSPTSSVKGGSHSGAQEGNDKLSVDVHGSRLRRVQTDTPDDSARRESSGNHAVSNQKEVWNDN